MRYNLINLISFKIHRFVHLNSSIIEKKMYFYHFMKSNLLKIVVFCCSSLLLLIHFSPISNWNKVALTEILCCQLINVFMVNDKYCHTQKITLSFRLQQNLIEDTSSIWYNVSYSVAQMENIFQFNRISFNIRFMLISNMYHYRILYNKN